jgi:hypothetical protein
VALSKPKEITMQNNGTVAAAEQQKQQDLVKPETTQGAIAPKRPVLPLVPTNMDEAWRFSQALADSSLLPQHYQGKPANVLAAFFMAADLGISAMQAMREIYVVKGKPGSSTALKVALVKQSPECLLWEMVESTKDKATFRTQRRGEKVQALSFTLEQAKTAGLYPGKEDSAWRSYPENMLRARAQSFLADLVYPDVVKGLRTKEELEEQEEREREVPGERVFAETSAPPPPPLVAPAMLGAPAPVSSGVVEYRPPAVSSPEPVKAEPVTTTTGSPAPALPEREPGQDDDEPAPPQSTNSSPPDPLDVFLAELAQAASIKDIDAMAQKAGDMLPKGHPRRQEVGKALNDARRRVGSGK